MAGLHGCHAMRSRLIVSSSVCAPMRAAASAASQPACPPPTTITSKCSSLAVSQNGTSPPSDALTRTAPPLRCVCPCARATLGLGRHLARAYGQLEGREAHARRVTLSVRRSGKARTQLSRTLRRTTRADDDGSSPLPARRQTPRNRASRPTARGSVSVRRGAHTLATTLAARDIRVCVEVKAQAGRSRRSIVYRDEVPWIAACKSERLAGEKTNG
jgi:hypothetical protein